MRKYFNKFSACRLCNHSRGCHSIYMPLWEGDIQSNYISVLETIPCNFAVEFSTYPHKLCHCTKFEPSDNLEYLEQKYEEKNRNEMS